MIPLPSRKKSPDDFDECLAFGRENEARLAKATGSALTDGRDYDLIFPDGRRVELKSDRFANERLFFKRLSDASRPETISGPWKAAALGVEVFAYLKLTNRIVYLFDSKALAAWLSDNFLRYAPKHPPSTRGRTRHWKGLGIAVPFDDVAHLVISLFIVP